MATFAATARSAPLRLEVVSGVFLFSGGGAFVDLFDGVLNVAGLLCLAVGYALLARRARVAGIVLAALTALLPLAVLVVFFREAGLDSAWSWAAANPAAFVHGAASAWQIHALRSAEIRSFFALAPGEDLASRYDPALSSWRNHPWTYAVIIAGALSSLALA